MFTIDRTQLLAPCYIIFSSCYLSNTFSFAIVENSCVNNMETRSKKGARTMNERNYVELEKNSCWAIVPIYSRSRYEGKNEG